MTVPLEKEGYGAWNLVLIADHLDDDCSISRSIVEFDEDDLLPCSWASLSRFNSHNGSSRMRQGIKNEPSP